jgi:hypothetical protein
MADTSIFSIEPPRWLQAEDSIDFNELGKQTGAAVGALAKTIGTMSSKGFQSKEQGKNFFEQMLDASRTANDPLYQDKVDAYRSQAELQQATNKDKLQGMKEYPEWLKSTNGDWKKILDTPFTGTSTAAAEMVAQQKQQAWMRSVQEQGLELKQTQIQNKLDMEQMRADLEAERIQDQKDAAAARTSVAQQDADTRKKVADKPQTAKSGSGIWQRDPDTGQWSQVVSGAKAQGSDAILGKIARAQSSKAALLDNNGKPMKGKEAAAAAFDKQISALQKQLDDAGSGTEAPAPTDDDISYLTAHPELRDKFELKFGKGSADQFLK